MTDAGCSRRSRRRTAEADAAAVFDSAVVDEAQDVSIAQLRFLAALGGGRPNALFFAGDLGQRIFQQPFSWKALGVDVRGRSTDAARELPDVAPDPAPGRPAARSRGRRRGRQWRGPRHTVSVFNGPPPLIRAFASEAEESAGGGCLAEWARADGILPTRDWRLRPLVKPDRLEPSLRSAMPGFRCEVLDERVETASGQVSHRHHAPRQGPRVPRRRGNGLRRRGASPSRRESRRSATMGTCRRSTTPSGSFSTSRAHEQGTGSS